MTFTCLYDDKLDLGHSFLFQQNINQVMFHACMSQDIKDHIFFMDSSHLYKYVMPKENKKKDFKAYPN